MDPICSTQRDASPAERSPGLNDEDFSWNETMRYEGSLVDSCNEVLIWIDRGVEEEVGWAYSDVETAILLQEASLSIRHWKSSCQWLAADLQDSEGSPAQRNKSQTYGMVDSTRSKEQDEDENAAYLFEVLETRIHPLSVTLRSCLDDIRRHLESERCMYCQQCEWVRATTCRRPSS